MRSLIQYLFVCTMLSLWAAAQKPSLQVPDSVQAGQPLVVATSGSGKATCLIAGPAGTIRKQVKLGENIAIGGEELSSAGRYVFVLVSESNTQASQFTVLPASQPSNLSFLAKPSRLPVNLADAISGVAYVFDAFHNLIVTPQAVSFELEDSTGRTQSRSTTTRDGVAWVRLNSAAKAGPSRFKAVAGNIREPRVIQQVPGDPCSLRMVAHGSGKSVVLETDPLRDCNGNPVPDGTIVSFTESYSGGQSTVDVPLKRGVARTELDLHGGATISVAAGVVMGNEIRLGGRL